MWALIHILCFNDCYASCKRTFNDIGLNSKQKSFTESLEKHLLKKERSDESLKYHLGQLLLSFNKKTLCSFTKSQSYRHTETVKSLKLWRSRNGSIYFYKFFLRYISRCFRLDTKLHETRGNCYGNDNRRLRAALGILLNFNSRSSTGKRRSVMRLCHTMCAASLWFTHNFLIAVREMYQSIWFAWVGCCNVTDGQLM